MTIREICRLPNPILRKKAKKVTTIDKSIQRIIDDMVETMQDAHAVGIAAPQIGIPLRIIVIQLPEQEPQEIINPKIVKRSGEREVVEGCLSFPGYSGEIKRTEKVIVKGLDRQGRAVKIRGIDLLAQALEHEIDHLNGTIYIDHLEKQDKLYKIDHKLETEILPKDESSS